MFSGNTSMRTGIVALAFGLLTLRFLPMIPPTGLLLVVGLSGLGLLWSRGRNLGLYLLGLCWACFSAQAALDQRLAPHLDGQTLWLEGVVSGLPEQGERSVRFELRDPQSRRGPLPTRLRLAWHGGPAVLEGERWRLAVKLKRPNGLVNPGGFDHEAWLLSRRLGATGSVKDGQRLSTPGTGVRDALRRRLAAVDAQGQEGALAALLLGDRGGIERERWQVLQATGTVHLMIISGQHIGLLAGLLYGLVAGLARLGAWPRRLPWLPWACGLAFAGALTYGWLAGFQVPVRRACLMLGLVLLWRLRYRPLMIGWPLLVALVLVLLIEPLASLQPGFWLSFGAVGVLLLVFAGRLGRWRWWHAWSRAQWLIAIGLLPMLLALGLPVSLSGPVANLLAVPWISLLVLPLALLGSGSLWVWPALGEALLWLAGGLLGLLFEWLGGLARAVPPWRAGQLPDHLVVLAGLGAFFLLLPAGLPLRLLGVPLLLLVVFTPRPGVPHGEVEVWHMDVGQGLAVLLRTRQHTLLYDAGPASAHSDAGEQVVLPLLRGLGVKALDRLLISHAHADHAGGALSVFEELPVGEVIAGEPTAMDVRLAARDCSSGQRWTWDGVEFALWRWAAATDSNSASCVLHVRAGGESLLLTGDIEAAAERALVASDLPIRAQWLQAPHHGSRTSSTMALLRAVEPAAVLISRGHGNSFGHPHPRVMARYRDLGIEIHDTALEGALKIQLGRFQPVWRAREVRRFWRDGRESRP
jgi:competence protein ComEC